MKNKMLINLLSVVVFLFFTTSVFAKTNTDTKMAQQVIESWFAAMQNQEVNRAAAYLAPQFTSIHTDGLVRNKAQEVELMKNLNMKSYRLTDFQFKQSGNVIIVTYKDKGMENIDNNPIATKAAGRMAILQKQGAQWLILAYANLDAIS